MKCPKCNSEKIVYYTLKSIVNSIDRPIGKCTKCNYEVTTRDV